MDCAATADVNEKFMLKIETVNAVVSILSLPSSPKRCGQGFMQAKVQAGNCYGCQNAPNRPHFSIGQHEQSLDKARFDGTLTGPTYRLDSSLWRGRK